MKVWHYHKNGNTFGPISDEELRQLISQGLIVESDLLWKEGFAEWIAAGKIAGLIQHSARPPAAPPSLTLNQMIPDDGNAFTMWFVDILKNKYADFNGRARRKEYWMFSLFNFLVSFAVGFIAGVLGSVMHTGVGNISILYSLATLIPAIAVGIRRMHDTNHSGWWLLVPFANLYLLFVDGQPQANRFGEDPKNRG